MTDQETYRAPADTPPAPLPNEPYYQPPPAVVPPKGRNAGLGAALVVVGLLLLAFQVMGRSVPFGGGGTHTLIDKAEPGNRIELVVSSADVEVQAWDGRTIKVEATQRGGSAGDYTVNLERSGDTVRVTEQGGNFFCWFCSRDVFYRISVPQGAQADLRTTSGDITVEGVGGAVALATTSGDVRAADLPGGLTVESTSGEVRLSHIGGALKVNTISGDVELSDGEVSGATVGTTSGGIDLDGVSGPLNLSTISGDISVQEARDAELQASTTSGEIEYDGTLQSKGNNSVSTISGDVQLGLPENSVFQLDASTVSGEISSEFQLTGGEEGARNLSGAVGGGGATLKVETTSGDIQVNER